MHNELRIRCTDCHFERVVEDGEDRRPADLVRTHGRETGHTLDISRSSD